MDDLDRLPSLPVELAPRIAAVCTRFEAAWRSPGPRIEDHIDGWAGDDRLALLRVLIFIDMYHRRLRGVPCPTADYQRRFPELAGWLAGATPADDEAETLAGPAEASSPALDAPPGYEVLHALGQGGMGVVYLARQTRLKRLVALKMIKAGTTADDADRARFQAEAEAIGRLNHPSIVQVYEVGTHRGQPFMALEYCPGGSLDKVLAARPMPAPDAARLVRVLAEAVHAAHAAQVIHRDLKPGNVLLTANGQPKVTDFGLVKKLDEVGQTQTGVVMGTPSYMPPEQALGEKDVGPAADVWSLGAILYCCLTGRPPFRAATTMDTLLQVLGSEPVPVRQLQPEVPRDLETVVHKCLQKDPTRRYPSAQALADDLGRFLDDRPILARPPGLAERAWRWCGRNRAVAASGAVVAVALVAVLTLAFHFVAERDAAEKARQVASVANYFRLLTQVRERNRDQPPGWTAAGLADLRQAAALRPDDDQLPALRSVAAACLGGVTLTERARVRLDGPPGPLAFAPDGQTLYVGRNRNPRIELNSCSVYRVAVAAGEVTRTMPVPGSAAWQKEADKPDGVRAVAVSPDGRWLVAGLRSGGLWRWDLGRDGPAEPFPAGHAGEVKELAFGHDGRALYSQAPLDGVRRWDATTWQETARYDPGKGDRSGLILAPAGEWVACNQSHGGLVFLDPITLRKRPSAGRLEANHLALAPDGRCLVASTEQSLRLHDLIAREPTVHFRQPGQETAEDDLITGVAVSPDGALVASACEWTRHVRLWDVASGGLLADTNVGGGTLKVAFAPDGRTLAVAGEKEIVLFDIGGWARPTLAMAPRPLLGAAWLRGEPILAVLGLAEWDYFAELTFHPLLGRDGAPPRGAPPPFFIWLNEFRDTLTPLEVAPGGTQVALPTAREITRWEPAATPLTKRLLKRNGLQSIQFGPDGRLWAAAGDDVLALTVPSGSQSVAWLDGIGWAQPEGTVAARWTIDSKKTQAGQGVVRSLAVGRRRVIAGLREGSIAVLDAADARQLRELAPAKGSVQSLAFDRDETVAVFGTELGAVGVLDAEGDVLAVRDAHADSVESVAFVTSTLLASGSRDRTVRLWRWRDGRLDEVLTLPFTGPVRRVAATADGARLAVLVRGERAVRVWRLDRLRAGLADLGLAPDLPVVVPDGGPFDAGPWAAAPAGPPGRVRLDLYQGAHFERLVHTRLDPGVDWDRPREPADPGLNRGPAFSVRWTCRLQPPAGGKYVLVLEHTAAARLWLDGRLIFDADHGGQFQHGEAAVDLAAAGHALRVEYRTVDQSPRCRLGWRRDGGAWEPIPSEWLHADHATAEGLRPGR